MLKIKIVIVTYLLTLRRIVFKILKSGRSFGSSFQHFIMILFKSSNVWSFIVGRNGTPNCGVVRFTRSIISEKKKGRILFVNVLELNGGVEFIVCKWLEKFEFPTFWCDIVVACIKWALPCCNLINNDTKCVNISFLCAFNRRIFHPEKLWCSPK